MENSQQNQQSQPSQTTTDQQAQKPKKTRTRKTIEQELAELEARKQKLLESKRKADAHEKIIFGATVIAMLKGMRKKGDPMAKLISDKLNEFATKDKGKDFEIIEKITAQILEIKPEEKPKPQGKIEVSLQGQQPQKQPQQSQQQHHQGQHQQMQNK